VRAGTYHDPDKSRISLSDWFEEYMRLAGPSERKTRGDYQANFKNHVEPLIGHLYLSEIDGRTVAEVLHAVLTKKRRTKSDGKATARQVHALLGRLFSVAVHLGRLPRHFVNPASDIRPPKPEARDVRPLDIAEVEAIASATPEPYRAMIWLLGSAGLRVGEACALRWRDVDLEAGWVLVRRAFKEDGGKFYVGTPKDDDKRDVPLMPQSVAVLRLHRKRSPAAGKDAVVFRSRLGKELRPSSFAGVFRRACAEAAVSPSPTPHILRHTAASLMARAGWPEPYIQAALGHGSAEMTRRYVHLYQGAHEENRSRLAALLHDELQTREVATEGSSSV